MSEHIERLEREHRLADSLPTLYGESETWPEVQVVAMLSIAESLEHLTIVSQGLLEVLVTIGEALEPDVIESLDSEGLRVLEFDHKGTDDEETDPA